MLDRHRSTWLDRLGRQIAGAPASLRFGIALAGFALFVGLTSVAWILLTRQFGAQILALAAASPKAAITSPAATFDTRLEHVTEIAKSCFLDAGLSRDHFITQFNEPREFGSHKFDFRYWEVWIPEDFDLETLVAAIRKKNDLQTENATLEQETIDAKTRVLKLYLDGINTHKFLFTKAAEEAPEGARVLLAYAPSNKTTIDIGAIPEVKYEGKPRLAIVIDDIGLRDAVDQLFFGLPGKVTFSVMPYSASGRQMATLAHEKGHEVMMHLPMEPLDMQKNDPGQGKVLTTMSDKEISQIVEDDIRIVPFVAGVNNHMGSMFTQNFTKMRAALGPIKSKSLFFLDSMTIGNSVAYKTAKEIGMHSAARNLFLDVNPDLESIRRQVALAGRIARAQGQAIAIGHPFQNTFLALQEELPKLLEQGVELVPVSQLAQ